MIQKMAATVYVLRTMVHYQHLLSMTTTIVSLIQVESKLDDPDYLGHLGHFLVGQVGLIHKLNYLDVTWIFNRSHVL